VAVIIVGLLTAVGFLAYGFAGGSLSQYNGPDAFLPAASVHVFDWVLAGVLLVLLLSNCARMWWFTVGRDRRVHVSASAYVRQAYLLPAHFLTQMRYARCEHKRPWVVHLILMLSYMTMLVLIMFFLAPMWAGPEVDWRVHAFGLAAAAGLLGTTIYALHGRLRKTEPHYKHSHETDWMFLVLLLVVAGTGLLQFTLHRLAYAEAANINYVVHMMAVVPMLLLEVPFSKWSHLAYRPLAMYFAELKAEAVAGTERAPARAPQAA
jgi:hypothetical protein